MWDVFLSHASEDKEFVAALLAKKLSNTGIRVWYDEFTLNLGDSLRRSIDHGLSESRFGVVILSPDFFRKKWPQNELDGMVAGDKPIIPVWHNVDQNDVKKFSPILADKVAISTTIGLEQVAGRIAKVVQRQCSEPPIEVILEVSHTGERYTIAAPPNANLLWLLRAAEEALKLERFAKAGDFAQLRIRWTLVDKNAVEDWSELSRLEQLQIIAAIYINGKVQYIKSTKQRLQDLGIYSGMIFNVFASENIYHYDFGDYA